ncbi:MAG TPA: TRAP transporter substrate-binding protein [Pseudonocardiaceae bacterium]|nr:TRAP transporter substrate-binding protein [Pseudonocardiaceae bacterium]
MRIRIRRRAVLGIVGAAVLIASAACAQRNTGSSGAAAAPSFTIIYAGQQAAPNPNAVAETDFAKAIESSSKGRIKVQVHTAGDLGGPAALLTAVKQGTIQMTITTPQSLASYYAPIGVLGLPFLFDSLPEAATALTSPAAGQLASGMESATGIKVLAWQQFGMVQLMGRDHAVTGLADLKKLRVRTIANKVATGTLSDVGAIPVPLDGSETYTALQQKTIDSNVDPISVLYSEKDWEISKYLTIVNVQDNIAPVVINAKFFDSLPKDLQQDVTAAAQQVAADEVKQIESLDQQDITAMQKSGVHVNTLSPDVVAQWRSATTKLGDTYDKSTVAGLTGGT